LSHEGCVNVDDMEETLGTLIDNLGDVLESTHTLAQALTAITDFSDVEGVLWRIEIRKEDPLKFLVSRNRRGAKLAPELCCIIAGSDDPNDPIRFQDLVLRLRTSDPSLYYREEWDSPRVFEKIVGSNVHSRVMFRCHFDRGKPTPEGEPKFHMHIGGVPEADEFCWFPKQIRSPRIPIPPLDLVLACEFIVSTFFPAKFSELQERREWLKAVYRSEFHHLRTYYEQCYAICKEIIDNRYYIRHKTLLGHFWLQDQER